jgi:hypothetical protein
MHSYENRSQIRALAAPALRSYMLKFHYVRMAEPALTGLFRRGPSVIMPPHSRLYRESR